MVIDKLSYQLKSVFYSKVDFDKRFIILGNTFSSNMLHYKGWERRDNGVYKNVTTYTIDKCGAIYQHYHPKYWSKFTGSEIDQYAISISLVNEGWLIPDGDTYYNLNKNEYTNTPINKYWRGYDFWAEYTEEQYISLKSLILKLTKDFGIQPHITPYNTLIKDITTINGVICRGNISKQFSDLSPLFDFNKLKSTN